MKSHNLALLLAIVLVLFAFTGCSPKQAERIAEDYEPQISESQARLISLNHAGVCIADVDYIVSELEFDDGRMQYDVSFYMNNVKYEYDINARSGDIISFEIDKD